jgi:hypothetical protein
MAKATLVCEVLLRRTGGGVEKPKQPAPLRHLTANAQGGCYFKGTAYGWELRQRVLREYDELAEDASFHSDKARHQAVAEKLRVSSNTVRSYVTHRDMILATLDDGDMILEAERAPQGAARQIEARALRALPACPLGSSAARRLTCARARALLGARDPRWRRWRRSCTCARAKA